MTMENSLHIPEEIWIKMINPTTTDIDYTPQLDRLELYDVIYKHVPPDEYIALGSRRPEINKPEPFPHYHSIIKRRDLQEWFPKLLAWKISDTEYQKFSTLGDKALVKSYSTYLEAIEDQKIVFFRAGKKMSKSIAAITIDLDVGRKDPGEAWYALGQIIDRARRGEFPTPGFVVRSGQGLYVIWLLLDEGTGFAPVANDENQSLYLKCNLAISQKVKDLEPDPGKLSDYSAWFKAPGTIDTKTGNSVIYMTIGIDSISDIPVYSLQDILKFVGYPHAAVAEVPQSEQIDVVSLFTDTDSVIYTQKKKRKVKIGKGSETAEARFRDIESIVGSRKNHENHREYFIWIYHKELLTYFRINKQKNYVQLARAYAEILNNMFKPGPLSKYEFEDALKHDSKKLMKSSTIARFLKVTNEEARDLNLKSILPEQMFKERKAEREKFAKERKQQFNTRRLCIDNAILNGKTNLQIMAEYGADYGPALTRSYLAQRRKKLLKESTSEHTDQTRNPVHEQLELPFQ